jgi:hypothetical protein
MTSSGQAPRWLLTTPDGGMVGHLEFEDDDWPWTMCRFEPGPGYAELAPMFERELTLLASGDWQAWSAAAKAVLALGLELRPQEGGAVLRPSLLHLDAKHAWFRD